MDVVVVDGRGKQITSRKNKVVSKNGGADAAVGTTEKFLGG